MSFHTTSNDIHVEVNDAHNCTLLLCMVQDTNGEYHPNKIRLDDHIGNTDGWFIWGGQNFTESAERNTIALEHTEHGPKLCAELHMRGGGTRGLQGILLGDKIENVNGHLKFLGP